MSLEPFKGLSPFNEKDADFFCGREEDIPSVKNMLLVHRLTILYGVAGVGKTSFLRAGVAPAMKHEAERNRKLWDFPGIGIVVFPQGEDPVTWLDDPLGNLVFSIREQIQAIGLDARPFDKKRSFGDFLKANAALFDNPHSLGRLFLILDQFELLLREGESISKRDFLGSFAEVINSAEVPVHILIALQSSEINKLAQLEGLVPALSGASLRIEAL